MTDQIRNEGEAFVAHYEARRRELIEANAYRPQDELDSCGVGLVASINGTPRRDVVQAGIDALKAVWHRGAVDADGKTGDGAGIHVQIPQSFFREHVEATGHDPGEARIAVGMVFLPRTDYGAQEACRCIVEDEILAEGCSIFGWRQVPVDISIIGEKANATRPEIEQIMIAGPNGGIISGTLEEEALERMLFAVRRRIEKRVRAEGINDFYICTLSCRSIVYKGMFLAEQLTSFYPDLLDERFESTFAIYHQRYSTNTFPTWWLAQPFRTLAHNGEINTIRGNEKWMKAHEPKLAAEVLGDRLDDIKPVIQGGSSDSASLDSVFELLVRAGRDAPMAKTLLIPQAAAANKLIPEEHLGLVGYANAVMEPWDGPAAIAATDGRWVVGGMDRNGLRPMRYTITGNGLLVAGSETGMVKVDESTVVEKGRLGPGQLIAVDLEEGKLYHDGEIKDLMAARNPYAEWVKRTRILDDVVRGHAAPVARLEGESLRRLQVAAGITLEDLELILHPMVEDAKEAIGSMGDDTPIAVLSDGYRGLHHFFRQNFSQVTNPPIDSLRERRVMSLRTRLGNLGNILDEDPSQCDLVQLESPVVLTEEYEALRKVLGDTLAEIDCTFDAKGGDGAMRQAIDRICREAEDAVRGGAEHIVLTDDAVGPDRIGVPMILATGACHTHLVTQNLRTFTSLNVRSLEAMDVQYFAVLIGVGATTINAYMAQECIADRHRRGLFGDQMSLHDALNRFRKAIDDGLLKVMSKMGISVISSYRGGCNFEAIGLSRSMVQKFFPSMPSRISGIGLNGIQRKVREVHARAFDPDVVSLPVGGFYRYRRGGERHAYEGGLIHTLQHAVATDSYSTYKKYVEAIRKQKPIAIRDLLDFHPNREPVEAEDVESITNIRKRFVTPGMSLGALSPEAHGILNVAMNRIGGKSDSGEGGELPERFTPDANGDNWNSAIKQVASGRFGVTAEYLNQCREIEIKVAQGAKPGEGGQLPGFKVTDMIAKLRHSTPGVMLISPPPHHDIYSIEDLAQLIYDLKQINPTAKVTVKLVSRTGIGTIAAGVAKAGADNILISGNVGGTGASPQTSLKFAGLPWEMGLAEVHQVLTLNRLRQRVRLRTDGGIKTGRDVVIAAILGAEEYGIGTASLVAMGCIMVRQCHSNTCPVGVCTQDPELREKFTGTAEKVVNLFSFMAEEVREILAGLGYSSLQDVIGRTELLRQVSRGAAHLDDLDLNPILVKSDSDGAPQYCTMGPDERNEPPDTLDAQMVQDAASLFSHREKTQLTYNIRNTQRAIGTRLSAMITREFGMTELQPGHVTVRLRGSAGQSLGAFAVQGLKIEVFGDANDYVGKGLSGGRIVVRPLTASPLASERNTIIGNTVLYGATAGQLFAAGQAGERFCVRNSGAEVVVEGCGSNGCEYMTGGTTVILGAVGDNFAAGMTGGMAFVYDADETFAHRVNEDSVKLFRVEMPHYADKLHALVKEHAKETGSRYTEQMLHDWDRAIGRFWQVVPKEMLDKLEYPVAPSAEQVGSGD